MSSESGKVEIVVKGAEAVAKLKGIAERVMRASLEAAGAGVRVRLVEHFDEREAEARPGRKGFPNYGQKYPSRHFWSGANGNSVAEKVLPPKLEGDTVTVAVDSAPLAHKAALNPPPIKPKGGRKYLAIPANARAAGWDGNPRAFRGGGEMKFGFAPIPDRPGKFAPALVVRKKSSANARATVEPQFWLVKQARTPHDPDAMPSAEELAKAATRAVKGVIRRLCMED